MPRKSAPPPPPPRLCEDNSTLKWYGATLNRSATVTGPTVQVAGPASPHSLLWLHSINAANVFESISTLISAVYVMQSQGLSGRRYELRWHYAQQHMFLRLRGHAAELGKLFVKHVWRNARIQRPAAGLGVTPRCFADAAEARSFTFMAHRFGGPALRAAARSFQRAVWHHYSVPPSPQPSATQAPNPAPSAVPSA